MQCFLMRSSRIAACEKMLARLVPAVFVFAELATALIRPSPVTAINISQYYGRWYQMYGSLTNIITNENHSLCETADYGPNPNGTISVLNRARLETTDGPEVVYPGWAEIKDPKKPGELVIHLQGVPAPGPYVIFSLGPATYGPDGLYEWAVVSSDLQADLFVLARDVSDFYSKWKGGIDVYLKQNGWDKVWNSPINITQLGCTYW